MFYIANSSSQTRGGSWSFINNLIKAIPSHLTNYEQATHYLIPGATMVQRDEVEQAKADGKKIVLRVDNAVRNSRNRNTGMTRMKDFARWADTVIYQSHWAENYLSDYLGKKGRIIHNSVDENIFNTKYRTKSKFTRYLYARVNDDETKNWEVARRWYENIQQKNKDAWLNLVGKFPEKVKEYNFDFYRGERFSYLGELDHEEMANIYKGNDVLLYTYFQDACSNTLIEALMSGLEIQTDDFFKQGSAYEIIAHFDADRSYFQLDRMAREYIAILEAA